MATNFLVHEKIWFDKFKYDDAERKFYEQMNGPVAGTPRQSSGPGASSGPDGDHSELIVRIASLEVENQNLRGVVQDLQQAISRLEARLSTLEKSSPTHRATAPQPQLGRQRDSPTAGERLRQYAEKKAKKPSLVAKSSILLDVKPWDDETDMGQLEACLLPVGYGIRKLQIQCVVEDDKVGTDLLEEEITKFEEHVQSADIAAFNKI
uniref:Elongation factor 1-delta n=1 Tax=Jaculus jaculus TaxID=51337 RepID=A0A8C5K073_JACJA